MASRVLKFESYAQRSRFSEDSYFPTREAVRAVAVAPPLLGENVGARFVRGCMIGIGLEALAAVGLYGLWQLWELFH